VGRDKPRGAGEKGADADSEHSGQFDIENDVSSKSSLRELVLKNVMVVRNGWERSVKVNNSLPITNFFFQDSKVQVPILWDGFSLAGELRGPHS
jgi:hypothetical protein